MVGFQLGNSPARKQAVVLVEKHAGKMEYTMEGSRNDKKGITKMKKEETQKLKVVVLPAANGTTGSGSEAH